jgi:hypothetical protein
VLGLPVGDYAISLALTQRARKDWIQQVERALPKGPDKSFGVGHVIALLSKLVEET